MKRQMGVSLSGLLLWLVVLLSGALLGLKVTPTVIEYYSILKDAKAAINQVGPDATVADVRKAYDKYAEVDNLELKSSELQIGKEGNRIVVSFEYEKVIPLFGNVSLLINYRGKTAGK
ncbi:MAG: DUF4845 domain-containing protein [Azonexus sp.]|nr:DUF4845 domain-containing protein [Azonexus sp.]MCK6412071.1 DUF4845 domain-containing protein [Azonexus sp.]